MLTETLAALAAAGGTAVVGAAGTSLWEGVRSGTARLFGRGDAAGERLELAQLDRTATALEAAPPQEAANVRALHAAIWRERLVALFEAAPEEERERLAEELRALVREHGTPAAREQGSVNVEHNTFKGPTALTAGNNNKVDVTFGESTK
ncbi:hypothetical protein GCM10009639_48660 [Kitasatospora putterlickiae]|uniref:Uncharacterized protein n=1 Tax=Kitasatospora putterlickiae TaxID=221725 RepID=A0ABN1YC01_9ACTN